MDIKKTGNAALRHDKVINESPANFASPVISFRVYVAGQSGRRNHGRLPSQCDATSMGELLFLLLFIDCGEREIEVCTCGIAVL